MAESTKESVNKQTWQFVKKILEKDYAVKQTLGSGEFQVQLAVGSTEKRAPDDRTDRLRPRPVIDTFLRFSDRVSTTEERTRFN